MRIKLCFILIENHDIALAKQNAKKCRAFQLSAKFIELNLYKRSKYHNLMRND